MELIKHKNCFFCGTNYSYTKRTREQIEEHKLTKKHLLNVMEYYIYTRKCVKYMAKKEITDEIWFRNIYKCSKCKNYSIDSIHLNHIRREQLKHFSLGIDEKLGKESPVQMLSEFLITDISNILKAHDKTLCYYYDLFYFS